MIGKLKAIVSWAASLSLMGREEKLDINLNQSFLYTVGSKFH